MNIKYKNLASIDERLSQYIISSEGDIYSLVTGKQMTISARNTVTLSINGERAKAYGIKRLMALHDDDNIPYVTKNTSTSTKEDAKKTLGVKVTSEMFNTFTALVQAEDRSASNVLTRLIKRYIKEQTAKQEIKVEDAKAEEVEVEVEEVKKEEVKPQLDLFPETKELSETKKKKFFLF